MGRTRRLPALRRLLIFNARARREPRQSRRLSHPMQHRHTQRWIRNQNRRGGQPEQHLANHPQILAQVRPPRRPHTPSRHTQRDQQHPAHHNQKFRRTAQRPRPLSRQPRAPLQINRLHQCHRKRHRHRQPKPLPSPHKHADRRQPHQAHHRHHPQQPNLIQRQRHHPAPQPQSSGQHRPPRPKPPLHRPKQTHRRSIPPTGYAATKSSYRRLAHSMVIRSGQVLRRNHHTDLRICSACSHPETPFAPVAWICEPNHAAMISTENGCCDLTGRPGSSAANL